MFEVFFSSHAMANTDLYAEFFDDLLTMVTIFIFSIRFQYRIMQSCNNTPTPWCACLGEEEGNWVGWGKGGEQGWNFRGALLIFNSDPEVLSDLG